MNEVILSCDEVKAITGKTYSAAQIKWLKDNEWRFVINGKNIPVIGRYYANMRLAGVEVIQDNTPESLPDFSQFN